MNLTAKRLAAFAMILTLAAAGHAQSVLMRGKVENVNPTGFIVDCTNVRLTSSTVDLRAFVGAQTEINGTVTSMSPVTVNVSAIRTIPRVFEIGGNSRIGREFSLEVTTTPGTVAAVYLAAAAGFLPVGNLGTVLLQDPIFAFAGVVPGGGLLQQDLPIPNDQRLVGVRLYGQSVLIQNNVALITNSSCNDVRGN